MSAATIFPRFSESEYRRREACVREEMARRGLDAVIVVGDSGRQGSNHANVYWLTNWVDPYVAYAILTATGGPWLLMSNPLYLHTARRAGRAIETEAFPYGKNPGAVLAEKLLDAGLAKGRVGIAGVRHIGRSSISAHDRDALAAALPEAKFEDALDVFAAARLIKSPEELAWFERGAMLTDRVIEHLGRSMRIGMSEQQVSGLIHEAVIADGGWMRVEFIGEDPTPEYQLLYDMAVECYDRVFEVLKPGATDADFRAAAAGAVERGGYRTHDVLLHGWGLQIEDPRLDVPSATIKRPQMPFTFKPGMLMVIQPNTVSPDEKRGLQVGNLVVIEEQGARSLQHYPMEFIRID